MNNDDIKNRFNTEVEEVKAKVDRRPWVAVVVSLVIGFISGAIIF